MTNLAVPFLVSGAEKDELQCLGTLCGRDQCSIIVSKRFTGQVLAFYLAEMRQVIGQMTLGSLSFFEDGHNQCITTNEHDIASTASELLTHPIGLLRSMLVNNVVADVIAILE